jgi:siderophore synthetase component
MPETPHHSPETSATDLGARTAVLARLWGALAREALPGLIDRHTHGELLTVRFTGGRSLTGPLATADAFAQPTGELTLLANKADAATPDRATPDFANPNHGRTRSAGPPLAQTDPAALAGWLWPGSPFALELADSVANLTLARAAQPGPDGGPAYLTRRPSLADLEQCVVDGHPLHPLCRTRLGLSPDEVRDYAPEHRPVVGLRVFAVPPDAWLSTGTGLPPRLLAHPWQADHVLDRYPQLVPTGETVPARPLLSLRTLAPLGSPHWHVKTSVDVQMTSAVRIVSPAAVRNGPVVSALAADLGARYGVQVLREPAGGALLVDGAPQRSAAMLRRLAPRGAPDEVVMPLAALAAPSPASGRPLVTEAIELGYPGRPAAFAAALVELLVGPLLRLLAHGVALEAHGQNVLVGLLAGRPVRLYYRDLGGVRLHPDRLTAAGLPVPPRHGDLLTDDLDELRTKVYAAAFGTVLAELAAVLGREYGMDPAAVWAPAAEAARRAGKDAGPNAGADLAALFGPHLPVKATTAMRLADDPLEDIWTALPNPLAGA